MKIGGLIFLIVGVVWMYQSGDFVSGKTITGQSQIFYVGTVTAIMGLALLISSAGRSSDR